jgi:hypothetical protein
LQSASRLRHSRRKLNGKSCQEFMSLIVAAELLQGAGLRQEIYAPAGLYRPLHKNITQLLWWTKMLRRRRRPRSTCGQGVVGSRHLLCCALPAAVIRKGSRRATFGECFRIAAFLSLSLSSVVVNCEVWEFAAFLLVRCGLIKFCTVSILFYVTLEDLDPRLLVFVSEFSRHGHV